MNLRQGRRKLCERYSVRICLVRELGRWRGGGGKLLISFFCYCKVVRREKKGPVCITMVCTCTIQHKFNLFGLQLFRSGGFLWP